MSLQELGLAVFYQACWNRAKADPGNVSMHRLLKILPSGSVKARFLSKLLVPKVPCGHQECQNALDDRVGSEIAYTGKLTLMSKAILGMVETGIEVEDAISTATKLMSIVGSTAAGLDKLKEAVGEGTADNRKDNDILASFMANKANA